MLPALHTLLLPGNYVVSLADCPVGSFTCLELLDLSFNALQSDCLPMLGQWPQLRQLDVSGTSISLNGTVLTGFACSSQRQHLFSSHACQQHHKHACLTSCKAFSIHACQQ